MDNQFFREFKRRLRLLSFLVRLPPFDPMFVIPMLGEPILAAPINSVGDLSGDPNSSTIIGRAAGINGYNGRPNIIPIILILTIL